jgi:hypothetical protein
MSDKYAIIYHFNLFRPLVESANQIVRRTGKKGCDIMTIEEIKKELPNVKMRVDGKIIDATLHGRCNPFATVGYWTGHNSYISYEYAWATIQRHLNIGKPLTV